MHSSNTNPSRREILAGLAGMATATVGGLSTKPAQAAAAFGSGSRSGLAWHSGSSISQYSEFSSYRGRLIDTITTWCPWSTWSDIVSMKGGFATAKNSGARVSLALPALPLSHSGLKYPQNWKLAASGSFDGYYTQFATKLRDSGETNVICRVNGWELNDYQRPWYCGTDPGAFKATFVRIAGIVRKLNPTVMIEWCNIKKGKQPLNIMEYYPGDDAVDIIGVNYYDGWPAQNTQAIWDSFFYSEHNSGPKGLGAWIEEARSRHKLFACSEWGISVGVSPGATDNALYIENMHETFSTNASIMAYENYFNQKPRHQLTPTDVNPKAAQKYKQLWG